MSDRERGHGVRRVRVQVIREPSFTPMTDRKRDICWDFGVPPRETPLVIVEGLDVELGPGRILFVTGPSGSGKSSVLREIAAKADAAIHVGRGRFPAGRSVVDAVAPRQPLAVALQILTACGLGEPRLWIRSYSDLSDGERFRAMLARAIGQAVGGEGLTPIVCDEFATVLHRRIARTIAYSLRKLVSRMGLMLVLASAQDDVLADLQPDQTIRLGGAVPEVTTQTVHSRPISLRRRVSIEPGAIRDYRAMGAMHYRTREGLGFVDKVFVLREKRSGEPLGVLVYAHGSIELAPRNRCTGGRFVRNVRRLNQELRILRRLVMHPDVRGCGLGHWFVRRTLPKVGVRFVECLAVMGEVNPVFERSGMVRVGPCPVPRGRLALLRRMQDLRVDPFSVGFVRQIAKSPRLRELVEKTIQDWVVATQGGRQYAIEGRSPHELAQVFRMLLGRPPVYYLWDKARVYPKAETNEAEAKVDAAEKEGPAEALTSQASVGAASDAVVRGERPAPVKEGDDPATTRTTRSRERCSPHRAPREGGDVNAAGLRRMSAWRRKMSDPVSGSSRRSRDPNRTSRGEGGGE